MHECTRSHVEFMVNCIYGHERLKLTVLRKTVMSGMANQRIYRYRICLYVDYTEQGQQTKLPWHCIFMYRSTCGQTSLQYILYVYTRIQYYTVCLLIICLKVWKKKQYIHKSKHTYTYCTGSCFTIHCTVHVFLSFF